MESKKEKEGSVRLARRLLALMFPDEGEYSTVGDLDEVYLIKANKHSMHARLWYWGEILKALPIWTGHRIAWMMIMMMHHLRMALRRFRKEILYSTVNLIGLSLGMACALTIALFLYHELSFDRFHDNFHRIYRISMITERGGAETRMAVAAPVHLDLIEQSIPELESIARVEFHYREWTKVDNRRYRVTALWVDHRFFDVFSFSLLEGDPEAVLRDPYSVVITPGLAKRYFGPVHPIGRTIELEQDKIYQVTGILKPLPANSHLQTEFIASLSSLDEKSPRLIHAYLMFRDPQDARAMEAKINQSLAAHLGEKFRITYALRPLNQVYMAANEYLAVGLRSDPRYSVFLFVLAAAVLTISCINFVNLTVARLTLRYKEVGLRKVIGARRADILKHYIIESLLYAAMATLIGLGLLMSLLPHIARWTDYHLSYHLSHSLSIYAIFLGITGVVGLITGLYPALQISRLHPAAAIKRNISLRTGKSIFRKGLVVFQFAVSIVFMIGTLGVLAQIRYMIDRDKGFEESNIIEMGFWIDEGVREKVQFFKEEMQKLAGVETVSLCDCGPGWDFREPYSVIPEGSSPDQPFHARSIDVDENYFRAFEIPIVYGNGFDHRVHTDETKEVMINESAVRIFGWKNPIGKRIEIPYFGSTGVVVGVVRDFHMETLRRPIKPWIFRHEGASWGQMIVKFDAQPTQSHIGRIRSVWESLALEEPFSFTFYEEKMRNLYKKEQVMLTVVRVSAVFSLFIACLGLFGLAAFSTEIRIKEIGIRKVLGASIRQVGLLISKDFLLLVAAANIIACPVVIILLRRWLQGFAYRIDIPVWAFFTAAAMSFLIALGTVNFHTIRAAMANPVDTLRCE